MLERFRRPWAAFLTPPAKFLWRLHISPDVVTWVGTTVVVVASMLTIPRGHLWQGGVLVLVLALSDGLDGQLARLSSKSSKYGAFLDSSLDRVSDGAIFGAIILYFAGPVHSQLWAGIALWALVTGQVTSYVRARGEALGLEATGGVAARADRIAIAVLGLVLAGVGVPYALQVAVLVLALLSTWTVGHRMLRAFRSGEGS